MNARRKIGVSTRRNLSGRGYCQPFSHFQLFFGVFILGLLTGCGSDRGLPGSAGPVNAESDSLPPSLNLVASPETVSPGGTVKLSWQSSATTSCESSGDWSGARPINGEESIGSLESSQTFMLSCSGNGGVAFRQVQIDVLDDDEEVSLSLFSDAEVVALNETVQISWSSSNADSCEARGAWNGQVATSGTFTSAPLNDDALFQLTCFGQGQSAISQLGVSVKGNSSQWASPT